MSTHATPPTHGPTVAPYNNLVIPAQRCLQRLLQVLLLLLQPRRLQRRHLLPDVRLLISIIHPARRGPCSRPSRGEGQRDGRRKLRVFLPSRPGTARAGAGGGWRLLLVLLLLLLLLLEAGEPQGLLQLLVVVAAACGAKLTTLGDSPSINKSHLITTHI